MIPAARSRSKTALSAGDFPVNGQNLTDAERHTRIKRWDQESGGPAVIDVPAAGTPLILEDGVEITFTTVPDGGAFRSGDYWIFVARTADASVEELEAAPPRGVHHHYCRLAVVTLPDVVLDCRTFLAAVVWRRGKLRLHDLRHGRATQPG